MITAEEILAASIPYQYSIQSKKPVTLCPKCKERDKYSNRSYCLPCDREQHRLRKEARRGR